MFNFMPVAFITHSDFLKHELDVYHPEKPARLLAIQDQLIASGLNILLHHYDAPLATREQLLRVHDEAYVDEIIRLTPTEGLVWLEENETGMNPYTLKAALRAAGAVVEAVDLVLSEKVDHAFCSVRPPGHHAERDRAMGFCIFNNIAVGAAHALDIHGIKRIVIVDFDVHHGNGTEDIFKDEPRVLFCSSFQQSLYPDSITATVSDHILKLPLPAGTDGKAFREAVEKQWLDRIDSFKPELVMISAGFDGHTEDDMANFNLVEADYRWITEKLCNIAKKHCSARIVSTLEGGYNLSALGRSVAAHIDALIG